MIDRQLLYDHWASWKCFLKFQPIKEIEQYFGTKIAFFFDFFGKNIFLIFIWDRSNTIYISMIIYFYL